MGNINNIWHLKDSGGDWASMKCELDDCYSIPYDRELDDSLFLQVDIPEGYSASEVWLTDMEGNPLQEILAITDWKIITGDGWNRLIFKVPQSSLACNPTPVEGLCVASILDNPLLLPYVQEYVDGTNPWSRVEIIYDGVYFDIDTDTLPPGFIRLDLTTFVVPCDYAEHGMGLQVYNTQFFGFTGSWPNTITYQTLDIGPALSCFRFEVPIVPVEPGPLTSLISEPFHCPECEPTVKISSDYCQAKTDIFGTFIFNTDGIGTTHYGNLSEAKNDFRIQAVLKKLPSTLKHDRNVRCRNFRSSIQQKYRLQGAMPTDFPDYMVNIIESIFSGKDIYIDGTQYVPAGNVLFTERNVAGRSMKKLDVELLKCEKGVVYDCSCEPASCEASPIVYDGIVFCTPAPEQGYGVDRSIWRFSIDMTALSGGVPPYTVSNWQAFICEGTISPVNAFSQPWSDSSDSNFYQRGGSYNGDCIQIDANSDGDFDDVGDTNIDAGCSCLSVLVKITDVRGCTKILGNTVDIDDLRCVEQNGDIVYTLGSTDITFTSVIPLPVGATFDISFDGINYPITGIATLPYTLGGLLPGTEYKVKIRINCGGAVRGYVGPLWFTTP